MCTNSDIDKINNEEQPKSKSAGRRIALAISLFFCVLSVILIVYLTNQDPDDSMTLSQGIYYWIAGYAIIHQIDLSRSWWFTPSYIRRFAHCAEFFALGLTSDIFFNCLFENKKKAGISSFAACIVFSFMDEFMKTGVPGREFDFFDMFFDFVGYILGIVVGTVIG